LLDEVFETLTASLRSLGAGIEFIGDACSRLPFVDETRDETCRRAIDAAGEAMHALDRPMAPGRGGQASCTVDLALHVGEVLYGNVGAVDRLDFT